MCIAKKTGSFGFSFLKRVKCKSVEVRSLVIVRSICLESLGFRVLRFRDNSSGYAMMEIHSMKAGDLILKEHIHYVYIFICVYMCICSRLGWWVRFGNFKTSLELAADASRIPSRSHSNCRSAWCLHLGHA